jgi:Uma2 family endonuclease
MASVLVPAEALQDAAVPVVLPRRKRFTRSEVARLSDAGVFEGQRYELTEGDLIDKMGQNPPHAGTFLLVRNWLFAIFGLLAVRCQSPIEVASEDRERNEPEPDFTVLADPTMDPFARHPRGDELLLLIEISDTTARFDRTVKSALYARASVREYWVVDLRTRALYVHRHASGDVYRQVTRLAEDETVAPHSRPDAVVKVSELLPPALQRLQRPGLNQNTAYW